MTLLGGDQQPGVRTEGQDIILVGGGPIFRVIRYTPPPPSHSLVKFQLNCASFNTAVHSLLEDQWKLDTPMSRSLSVG